ncbi:MAG: hypothetical protein NC308_01945 [Clostridium sp.]|nr:hypothetical protein [Bacteroides sp.]MCM1197630.1 hypothetical protein [Clostridium sp.]
MKKFGLIGHPIAHSLSPALFKAGYRLDVPQIAEEQEYSYDLIEGENFTESYRTFLEKYDGINVTAPFKELAFAKADIISPECRLIGATNLLVKSDEGIRAYNSDYYGIILTILDAVSNSETLLPPRPSRQQTREIMAGKARTALVVGAGGAGKAAAIAAAELGLETTLMNRTVEKVEKTASELPQFNFKVRGINEFLEAFTENDIIIYTLPKPLEGMENMFKSMPMHTEIPDAQGAGSLEINSGRLSAQNISGINGERKKYILEANYRNPALKDIISSLNPKDITYIPGEKWLLYQAYAGYDLFTGKTPSLSRMASVISAE